MRENPDEEGNVVSYDVLMDADTRESTMSVDNVKVDVEHARKEVKSSAREGREAGGRGGDKNNETSGSEVGSGSDEGGKGSGLEGVGESGDRDSGELSDEGDRDKKSKDATDDPDEDRGSDGFSSHDDDDEQSHTKKGQKPGSGKRTGQVVHDDTDEDTDTETGRWGGGDCGGIARVGRAFDLRETAWETWENAFSTLIGELNEAGYLTVQKRRRKLIGCPFMITMTWRVGATNPTITSSKCEHNHDPRGAVSRAQADVLPLEVVDERYADIRKWTAAGVGPTDIFKLLEMDHDGKTLDKVGKRKVYNAIHKVQDELYSTPEDGADFLAKLGAEPGMFVKRTFDDLGRIVNVFWAPVDQQEKMSRFGGCAQMDTTVLTNRPKVMLTDADRAMTSALEKWTTTLHLFCLWHVFKNVLKNCSSSFPDKEERAKMLRLFRSAAYAATPEAFARYRVDFGKILKGKKCEEYIDALIQDKTKWVFSCRPTLLTMGMVATQRTEGMFGVAKRSGVHKKLSLCGLWEKLQLLYQKMDIEYSRVATRGVGAELPFQAKHLQGIFAPILEELKRVGASQYCQVLILIRSIPQEARAEVGGSQSYDVEVISAGATDDDGRPHPMGEGVLRRKLEAVRFDLSLFEEAPADTDLENDCMRGPEVESTEDSSVWARTHYFAVLVRFLGCKFKGILLDHRFDGNSVHARWRQSLGGNDEPWTVSRVLKETGHGDGWDGCDKGADDNFRGPTFDNDDGEDGVHPSERAAKAAARSASDERRVFASMMTKCKENVSEILRTVPHTKAMEIQADLDRWVRFQLLEATGQTSAKNPAQVKKAGRPKKSKSGEQQEKRGDGNGAPPGQTGSARPVGNPQGRLDRSRRAKRMRDSTGPGSGGPSRRIKKEDDS
eukprot:g15736.t1